VAEQARPPSVAGVDVERILESLPDGVVVVDSGGTLIYANCQAGDLSGYSPVEICSRSVKDLFPGQLQSFCPSSGAGISAPPVGSVTGLRLRRRDGSSCRVDVALASLQSQDASLVVAVFHATPDPESRATSDRDRQRIVNDLHEKVIRPVFGVAMTLQGAAVHTDDPGLRSRLEAAVQELDSAISTVRTSIFGLCSE
jgi:PAS domain S-box-containing protein